MGLKEFYKTRAVYRSAHAWEFRFWRVIYILCVLHGLHSSDHYKLKHLKMSEMLNGSNVLLSWSLINLLKWKILGSLLKEKWELWITTSVIFNLWIAWCFGKDFFFFFWVGVGGIKYSFDLMNILLLSLAINYCYRMGETQLSSLILINGSTIVY